MSWLDNFLLFEIVSRRVEKIFKKFIMIGGALSWSLSWGYFWSQWFSEILMRHHLESILPVKVSKIGIQNFRALWGQLWKFIMTLSQISTCLAMLWKRQISQVFLVFILLLAYRSANRDSQKCFCHFLIKHKEVISAQRQTSMILMFHSLSVR